MKKPSKCNAEHKNLKILFCLHQVRARAKGICGVQIRIGAARGQVVTKGRHKHSLWSAGDFMFLNLGTGDMDVLASQRSTDLYPYDLYAFLYADYTENQTRWHNP